jgi:hypothetical protein
LKNKDIISDLSTFFLKKTLYKQVTIVMKIIKLSKFNQAINEFKERHVIHSGNFMMMNQKFKQWVDKNLIEKTYGKPSRPKMVYLMVDTDSYQIPIPHCFRNIFYSQSSHKRLPFQVDWNLVHDDVEDIHMDIFSYTLDMYQIQIPDKFPKSLKYLTIYYHEPILRANTFPDSLIELRIIFCSEDIQIENSAIPKNVQKLIMNKIEQPITKDFFPINLRYLQINNISEPILPGSFPDSLKIFKTPHIYDDGFQVNMLPENLEYLIIRPSFMGIVEHGLLPPNLKKLEFDLNEDDIEITFEEGLLPHTLKWLKIACTMGCKYSFEPGGLPEGLKTLILCDCEDGPVKFTEGILPSTLEKLYLNYCYEHEIDSHLFPPSLKYITNQIEEASNYEGHTNVDFCYQLYKYIESMNQQTRPLIEAWDNYQRLLLINFDEETSSPPPRKRGCGIIQKEESNIFKTLQYNLLLKFKIMEYLKPERDIIQYDIHGFFKECAKNVIYFTLHDRYSLPETYIHPKLQFDEDDHILEDEEDNSFIFENEEDKEEEDPSEYDETPASPPPPPEDFPMNEEEMNRLIREN